MTDIPSLPESDVRSIVRLIAEIHSVPGDRLAKKRALMGGLCGLIDANRWFWGLGVQPDPASAPAYVCLEHGGFTPETYAAYIQAYEHPAMNEIQAKFGAEIAKRQTHLTRHRRQLDPDDSYERGGAYPLWQKADINGVIMSFRPMDQTSFSVVALYRRVSAPIFSDRDNRVAHIVLTGVPYLHEQGWPEDRAASLPLLSPRQRMVLSCLIQGFTRGQIAEHLEISQHTVNEYVKAVFAHFGVHSQPALIARFRSGDGGDG